MSLTNLKNVPSFYDNKVSTRTYIVSTNLEINIDPLFEHLPVTNYVISKKRRGRRKKSDEPDPNAGIPSGAIITIKYKNKANVNLLRGVQRKKKSNKNFRNSLTVVMICQGKPVNLKISTNGRVQMTGCKNKEQVIESLTHLWFYIRGEPALYSLRHGSAFELMIIPAMRNIDFNLGFLVNRERLSAIIREMPGEEYRSMLEPSFGYTGVNIKFEVEEDIVFMNIDRLVFEGDAYRTETLNYSDYLDTLPEKEQNKKLLKKRYNTFLVFYSGMVIMSGITEELMESTYYRFLEIVDRNYDIIKEKLEANVSEKLEANVSSPKSV